MLYTTNLDSSHLQHPAAMDWMLLTTVSLLSKIVSTVLLIEDGPYAVLPVNIIQLLLKIAAVIVPQGLSYLKSSV